MTSEGPKIISTLGVNYKPAIDATKQLMGWTAKLDHQLRTLRITASDVGRNISTQFHAPMHSGQVILDRHGRTLVDVGEKTRKLAETTQRVDDVGKRHIRTVRQTAEAYSILGSQWERRISWFVAGVGFYGFIRTMRQAMDTMRQVEADMIVIARTTNDVTFSLEHMRNELQRLGVQYGHTWETVSDIALRWTQAGYDMADTLEQTRVGLLALNVAEMDVQMASQGMIAIMSQWEFTAQELETVIDKLNITSDNFAVTTGDLVEALVRASGAARAVGMSFEETIGIVTAMRVATGRTGREVGNATNTILAFMYRQQTINKLMEAGINVFADAAQTRLRPAMETLTDIADQWGHRAEEMPEQLLEIAEQMGLMSEEMAEMVGLQEEWTDLQKIDIESSAAGIRRRSFFIALLRNFAQVQEVVNNMYDVEGYSMRQNILTMETLDKKYKSLQASMEALAVTMGDAGMMMYLKDVVDATRDAVEWFDALDERTQTLILSFVTLTIATKALTGIMKMLGLTTALTVGMRVAVSGLTAAFTALGNAMAGVTPLLAGWKVPVALTLGWKVAIIAAGAALVTYSIRQKRANELQEQYAKTVHAVSEEQERLDGILEKSIEGSNSYNLALEQKRDLTDALVEQYPQLIAGYDAERDMWILNNDEMRSAIQLSEELLEQKKEERDIRLESIKAMGDESDMYAEAARDYEDRANRLENMMANRERLIQSIKEEGDASEEAADKKEELVWVNEAIIRVIGNYDATIKTSADITESNINRMITKFREMGSEAIFASRQAMQALINLSQSQLVGIDEDLARVGADFAADKRTLDRIMRGEMPAQYSEHPDWAKFDPLGYGARLHWLSGDYEGRMMDHVETITQLRQTREEVQRELNRYEEIMSQWAEGTDAPDGTVPPGTTTGTAEERQRLIDAIREFIAITIRAAQVQGMVNDETQRQIELSQARIEWFSREGAEDWERNEAKREEARLLDMLAEKQRGIHEEANLWREALEKLRMEQENLDTSTEDWYDSYLRLESQMESIKDTTNKLSIEWFKLEQEKQRVAEATDDLSDKLKELAMDFSMLDFYARMGLVSARDMARITREAYAELESLRALTAQEEMDRLQRLSGYYRDMYKDMLSEAEDAYRERLKLIDMAAEEEIKIYQRMLDALDEERKLEDREETRRQHENRMNDLLDRRRYHELRTGVEHVRAIEQIDKDLAEEQHRFMLQQREWARQDAREHLQQQIRDVQIAAEAEKAIWEDAYKRMQADFSDHNLNLLSIAATYDEDFFKDGYNKGQLWIAAFQLGIMGVQGDLSALLGRAHGVVPKPPGPLTVPPELTAGTGDDGSGVRQPHDGRYDIDHSWGHTYTVSGGGHTIYKDGRYVPPEDFHHLPPDILDLARDMKVGKAHTGARTLTGGIAELLPGELIFPPNLSTQIERLIGVLTARPMQQDQMVGTKINNFYAPLFNSERTYMEDEADIELYARAMKRQMANL